MMLLKGISEATKAFITRVEADGGIVESPRCVAKKLPE
jgi:hypothetical protein